MPTQLELLNRTALAIQNPLFRFLEREVTVASALLELVKSDLFMLIDMCKGNIKSTNMLKQLAEDLHSDVIPKRWRKYTVAQITATIWVNDFVRRVIQLQDLSKKPDFGQSGLWLGGLLFPEAYLTATRQSIAQKNNWSLEELKMEFKINPTEEDRRQTGGRYSARLRRGNRGYPGDAEQNSLADWPVDEARLVEDVVTVESLEAEAEANKPVVPEGWYSATAEFSSPLISYSAAPSIKKH